MEYTKYTLCLPSFYWNPIQLPKTQSNFKRFLYQMPLSHTIPQINRITRIFISYVNRVLTQKHHSSMKKKLHDLAVSPIFLS